MATKLDEAPLAYLLSLGAGLVYVVATIALATDRRTLAWWAVSIEMVGVLAVGVLSLVDVGRLPRRDGVVGVRAGLRLRPAGAAVPRAGVAVAHRADARRAAGVGRPRVKHVYRLLFDLVFRRMDPERAHELAFRADPGGRRRSRSCAALVAPGLRGASDEGAVRGLGATVPVAVRAGGRVRQERGRRRGPDDARLRLRRGGHGHRARAAGQRAATAVARAGPAGAAQPDGLQQRGLRGGRGAGCGACARPRRADASWSG